MKLVYLLFVMLFVSFLLLSGCTDGVGNLSLPYTTSQFINRSTDLNYSKFVNGDYNAKILYLDKNKLSARDINQILTTQILNPLDTNWQTSWTVFDTNMKTIFQTIANDRDTNTFTKCGDTNKFVLGTGECVDYTASITYYPSTVAENGSGSITDSNIELIKYYDDVNMVFVEGSGANPLNIDINFSGVIGFSQLILREYYLGSSSHVVKVQLWDYDTSTWQDYFEFVGQSGYTIISVPVLDASEHIGSGLVQLRLYHVQNGVTTHRLYMDFAWLVNGQTIGGSTNLNGYARYSFGNNNFDGNGTFTTTGTGAFSQITIDPIPDAYPTNNLILKGDSVSEPFGGSVVWYKNNIDIGGYTYTNYYNRFVWDNAPQIATDYDGKAWIDFGSGEASFDEGTFTITGGNIYNKLDNGKHYFGAGDDATIYYDGINMFINPREIGTGQLRVLGDLNVANGRNIYDSNLTTGRVVFPTTAGLLTGDGNFFWDNTNKRLGLGTSSPAIRLDIVPNSGDSGAALRMYQDNALGYYYTFKVDKAVNGALTLYSRNGSGGDIMGLTVNRTGQVGVGTTAPGTAFDVNGSTTLDYTLISGGGLDVTGGNGIYTSGRMMVAGTSTHYLMGNTGIKTLTPQNVLNVVGDINATTSIRAGTTIVAGGNITSSATIKGASYQAGSGTDGFTGTCYFDYEIYVEDGLITGCNPPA